MREKKKPLLYPCGHGCARTEAQAGRAASALAMARACVPDRRRRHPRGGALVATAFAAAATCCCRWMSITAAASRLSAAANRLLLPFPRNAPNVFGDLPTHGLTLEMLGRSCT